VLLFCELLMVVGTCKLSTGMKTKGNKWYVPSGEADEAATGADQLNQVLNLGTELLSCFLAYVRSSFITFVLVLQYLGDFK
jgi:hypothetical protein